MAASPSGAATRRPGRRLAVSPCGPAGPGEERRHRPREQAPQPSAARIWASTIVRTAHAERRQVAAAGPRDEGGRDGARRSARRQRRSAGGAERPSRPAGQPDGGADAQARARSPRRTWRRTRRRPRRIGSTIALRGVGRASRSGRCGRRTRGRRPTPSGTRRGPPRRRRPPGRAGPGRSASRRRRPASCALAPISPSAPRPVGVFQDDHEQPADQRCQREAERRSPRARCERRALRSSAPSSAARRAFMRALRWPRAVRRRKCSSSVSRVDRQPRRRRARLDQQLRDRVGRVERARLAQLETGPSRRSTPARVGDKPAARSAGSATSGRGAATSSRASRRAVERLRVELLEQPAAVQDADARGQARDLAQDVARHEDGHAAVARQLAQQLADLDHARRVEPVGRLVEDEQLRLVQQRPRQPQPLRVAERQRAGAPVGVRAPAPGARSRGRPAAGRRRRRSRRATSRFSRTVSSG